MEIVAVIVKIRFGDESEVYPETYLRDLERDKWNGWGTPTRYKYLDGGGKKLILYDPIRKALTAEVEIRDVELQKGGAFPWRHNFSRGTVRIYRPSISVERVRAVQGLETFSVHRKDRTSHRNLTLDQYLALVPELASSEASLSVEQSKIDSVGEYTPKSAKEGRRKVLRSIALRRGQQQFRDNLLWAYNGRCCVTGTSSREVLEAAHIQPYADSGTNSTRNGLLLRSDIHVLFDLHLLSIDPSSRAVFCSKRLRNQPAYASLHRKKANLPAGKMHSPDSKLLRQHFEQTKA